MHYCIKPCSIMGDPPCSTVDSYKLIIFFILNLLILNVSSVSASEYELHLLSFEDPPYVNALGEEKAGLAVDIVKELMARTHIRYKMDFVPAKRALIMAAKQNNTCVFPVVRSQEREVRFAWVSPVVISRYGFFKRSNDSSIQVRSLTDALPYNIGSSLGSGIAEYLKGLSFEVDLAATNDANIIKLNAKRIDLWASDTLSARYIMNSINKGKVSLERVFFTALKGMGCHADVSDLTIERLSQTLKAMYQDGTIEKIQLKYAPARFFSPG